MGRWFAQPFASKLLLSSLVLITAFLGCWAIIVPEPGADIATKAMRRVCLTVDTPLVRCSPGSDASTAGGYEVQLFKETAAFLVDRGFHEWSPNNWTFFCMVSVATPAIFARPCTTMQVSSLANLDAP
ncbi:PBPe domain-containing protein [Haematococcus lacustris]|uniref:PBPe domain-containing protein n=1 Tax=Haematococcus lacustris TaxID=44745 RepID=A0A699YMX0_HAELA|nr:PBPe domain-containing protein [Haematococcus lacustris]